MDKTCLFELGIIVFYCAIHFVLYKNEKRSSFVLSYGLTNEPNHYCLWIDSHDLSRFFLSLPLNFRVAYVYMDFLIYIKKSMTYSTQACQPGRGCHDTPKFWYSCTTVDQKSPLWYIRFRSHDSTRDLFIFGSIKVH